MLEEWQIDKARYHPLAAGWNLLQQQQGGSVCMILQMSRERVTQREEQEVQGARNAACGCQGPTKSMLEAV